LTLTVPGFSLLGYMTASERRAVNIRLDAALVEALDAAATVAPTFSRHAIARVALHIGLAAITKDRTLMLEPAGARWPAKKKRDKRAAK
jgi:hypothetical protein